MANFNLNEKLEKCKKIHDNKYNYSLVDYKHSKIKVKIICPIHGVFEQVITKHEKGGGCQECGNIKRGYTRSTINRLTYIDKCKKQHPHFDYSKTNYINFRNKVTITCKIHGDWDTDPFKFLTSVVGCPECSYILMLKLNREKTFGWDKETWKKKGEAAKKFDSFKAYVIKCWNDDEVFYKVGKTFNKLKKRFSCNEDMPYKFEVVHVFEYKDAFDAHNKEEYLKQINSENKYVPKIKFPGMYECFISVVVS